MTSSPSRRAKRAGKPRLTREQRAIMRISGALIDAADTGRVKAALAAHKAARPDGWTYADVIMFAAQLIASELALQNPHQRAESMTGLFALTQDVLEQIDSRATETRQ